MTDCTDKELGQMLHDYELGLLSEDDTERFEMHLFQCEHCDAQVRDFTEASRIMTHDTDAKELVGSIAGKDELGVARQRKAWTPFTKLLIAAVVVLVLAVPIYRYWLQPEEAAVVQTLELLPTRTTGSDVVYLEKGGEVEIIFYAGKELRASADIVISEFEGDTVLVKPGFSDFNDQGLGTLTVSISDFREGHYVLTIKADGPDTDLPQAQYMFRVK